MAEPHAHSQPIQTYGPAPHNRNIWPHNSRATSAPSRLADSFVLVPPVYPLLCTGASSMRHRRFPGFVSPTLWSPNSPDLNPEDYSIWSVGLMQEKVYQSRIANVNELEMRLND